MRKQDDQGRGDSGTALVPVSAAKTALAGRESAGAGLLALVLRAGAASQFAAEEFFYGEISNANTRAAYRYAVERFLARCEERGLELAGITPRHVREYLDTLTYRPKPSKKNPLGGPEIRASVPTQKQHLAALRHFFDVQVTRHAMLLNPALSVRGPRYQALEGKTPEITPHEARTLRDSIDPSTIVGLRDRAMISTLIYTARRVNALAKLRRADLSHSTGQWNLRFTDKGTKVMDIPVRHDLEAILFAYVDAAGLRDAPSHAPLFRSAAGRTGRVTENAMHVNDICRMVKRRLKDAGLSLQFTGHSFRVTTITDLLGQGIELKEVQQFVGHADPRTTQLYDRTQKRVTRNLVERISI
jgi:site-specific recombinase XerD